MHRKGPKVTVVVGGQAGSEGKGAICAYLADNFDVAVRVGAPNAGHTVMVGKQVWKMQQIPCAGLVNPDINLCIGAAGLINLGILKREAEWIPHCKDRLFIDRNAGILTHDHIEEEESVDLNKKIGSTCEGVGAALRHKIKRDGTFKTAKDVPELRKYAKIVNVASLLNSSVNRVMIEGTQGWELCLNHGPYPFCTSRDVIASSLLSDVGMSPMACDEIIMVVRTYPIRVAGNSGPMGGKETTWGTVTERSKSPNDITEKTTVTKRTRRVFEFNIDRVVDACRMNGATQIALTFADYLDYSDHGKTKWDNLSDITKQFVKELEAATETPVTYIKTGPFVNQIVDRSAAYKIMRKEGPTNW